MLKLIKNANLFAPKSKGMNDILIADNKIACIDKNISLTGVPVEVYDAAGKIVTPGFIDQHVHITGGGAARPDMPLWFRKFL